MAAKLALQIRENVQRSQFSNNDFLPNDAFQTLINKETVSSVLKKRTIDGGDSLLEFILSHARKTFATLILSKQQHRLCTLEEHGFTDEYLPIEYLGGVVHSKNGATQDDPALKWFQSWAEDDVSDDEDLEGMDKVIVDSAAISLFCDLQWTFLAPIFSESSTMLELSRNHRLPITKLTRYAPDDGGFSTVRQGCIHEAHATLLGPGDKVAVKELKDASTATEKAFAEEIYALSIARDLKHPHLVKFIAGFKQDNAHYLIFKWAHGGSIRTHWSKNPLARDHRTISWAVGQIKGVLSALKELHKRIVRHGDLKPDNILVTENETLQIADMGLSKQSPVPTRFQKTPSGQVSGTTRYQSPEAANKPLGKRSRSDDMWSMGCIILEFIIWLLYGCDELERFNASFKESFFILENGDFSLQDEVLYWIEHMKASTLRESSSECVSGLLKDLLNIVVNRVLIADPGDDELEGNGLLSPIQTQNHAIGAADDISAPIRIDRVATIHEIKSGPRRADINELYDEVELISSISDENYIFKSTTSTSTKGPAGRRGSGQNSSLLVRSKRRDSAQGASPIKEAMPPRNTQYGYLTPPLPDTWTILDDNSFAGKLFGKLTSTEASQTILTDMTPSLLCEQCSNPNTGICSRNFSRTLKDLRMSRERCQLCELFLAHLEDPVTEVQEPRRIFRQKSYFTTTDNAGPVLSILIGPGSVSTLYPDIQRGFPKLPESGGKTQIKLLRRWIDHCDDNHPCSKDCGATMPTRLLDVEEMRLDCETERSSRKYIALSHKWGDPDIHGQFYTTRSKLEVFQAGISFDDLPKTFKNAVEITRALEIRYLWIDSLCIVQEDHEDWKKECERMEDVYSSAYCTLAASCASGTTDGFLKPRPAPGGQGRQCHSFRLRDGTSTFCVCSPIDNFIRDVEKGALSKRGWIFQERALSRRTIHFTGTQVYWECGNRFSCETFTRFFNLKASFLSDPKFPASMQKHYDGTKIRFFVHIYEKYSGLDFTKDTDRLMGIAGLERRLATQYNTDGLFGILNRYLRRSLLWRRDDTMTSLHRISYPEHQIVPSWSWMAIKGAVKYMDIPFDTVDWDKVLQSPFDKGRHGSSNNLKLEVARGFMGVVNRVVSLSEMSPNTPLDYDSHFASHGSRTGDVQNPPRDVIYFDRPEDKDAQLSELGCVVIGEEKSDQAVDFRRNYVLVVKRVDKSDDIWERVGAGTLFGSAILSPVSHELQRIF